MSQATRIRELIQSAGSQFVSVHFIKADGELRQLTFNPKHIGEIKGTGHALKDPAAIENIVRCMDIAKGWRSFDCRRVCKLTVNGETFEFNLVRDLWVFVRSSASALIFDCDVQVGGCISGLLNTALAHSTSQAIQ
jgi:hypothetical protein